MRKENKLNEENGKRTNMKKGEDIKKWNKWGGRRGDESDTHRRYVSCMLTHTHTYKRVL